MGQDITQYFRDLADLFAQIEVTDEQGDYLPLATGLERAVALISSQPSRNGKVIFIGNGGSATIASHQAIDYWKNGGIPAIAFNDAALLTCISNDFGYEQVFEKPIERFADARDILVAISSSGQSENILRGVRAASARGCQVITMSGFDKANPLRSLGTLNFYVPASFYGFVEISHLCLCHSIIDAIISRSASEGRLAHPLRGV